MALTAKSKQFYLKLGLFSCIKNWKGFDGQKRPEEKSKISLCNTTIFCYNVLNQRDHVFGYGQAEKKKKNSLYVQRYNVHTLHLQRAQNNLVTGCYVHT